MIDNLVFLFITEWIPIQTLLKNVGEFTIFILGQTCCVRLDYCLQYISVVFMYSLVFYGKAISMQISRYNGIKYVINLNLQVGD